MLPSAMKFGINTFLWTASFDTSHAALLPPIKEHGFDGFEVSLFDPATFDAKGIRRLAEANGLESTVCCVLLPGFSLIDEDASVRSKTVTHLKACIESVAEAGAKLCAGPVYSPVGYLPGRRRTEDEWKRAVEGYHALGDTLAKTGVTLAIEPLNRFETFFLNTAEDAARLCDQVAHPNVGILFDTFHANIEEKDVPQGYRTVARHLKHVHTCENDRGTPGSGHVDWTGVFQALSEIGYDGWLTIESFGSTVKEIAAAASIWRDLAPTPDEIAWKGIEFLKANTIRSEAASW